MKIVQRLAWIALGLGMTASAGCPNNPVVDDAFVASGIDANTDDTGTGDMDAPSSGEDAFADPDAFAPSDAAVDVGPPDATGPPCTMEGQMRSQSCTCGYSRIETCVRGNWRETERCSHPVLGDGWDCDPGTTRPRTQNCQTGTQTCTGSCQWGEIAWDGPLGECRAGSPADCFNGCPCTLECRCLVRRGDECI